MPRTNVRIGTAFVLAFALVFVSGVASAKDGDVGTPEKPENAPAGWNRPVTVTANSDPTTASQIIAGIQLTNGSGLMHGHVFSSINMAPTNNPTKDKNGGACSGNDQGEPIEVSSGTKLETFPIFALPGEMGLKYIIYYNTAAHPSRWTNNFDYLLDTDCADDVDNTTGRCTHTTAYRPDGSTVKFSGGPNASTYLETFEDGQSVTNPVATLSRNPVSGDYTLQDEDGLTEIYSSTGGILSIKDASGIGWTFSVSTGQASTVLVTHTNGQSITVNTGPLSQTQVNGKTLYDQVVSVIDPAGNTYTLDYGNANSANAVIDSLDSILYPGSPATTISLKYSPVLSGYLTEVDYNSTPMLIPLT